jgi:hypothetical protein
MSDNPIWNTDILGDDTLRANAPFDKKKGDVIDFGHGQYATMSVDETKVTAKKDGPPLSPAGQQAELDRYEQQHGIGFLNSVIYDLHFYNPGKEANDALVENLYGVDAWTGEPVSKTQAISSIGTGLSSIALWGVTPEFKFIGPEVKTFTGYIGVNPNTKLIEYVGITFRTVEERAAEHKLAIGTGRELLVYSPVFSVQSTSSIEVRIWEQEQINFYGMQKNGGQLLNLKNSIAPQYWEKFGIKP